MARPATLLLCALALALASCAGGGLQGGGLPDYARPRAETIRAEQYQATDVIRYRQVTRADFRATAPPVHAGDSARHMGALTCATIVPDAPTRVTMQRSGSGKLVGRLVGASFHAEMDRGCSWWNDRSGAPADYVLQHEQIHFALTELQARRLSDRAARLEVEGASAEAVTRVVQERYDRLSDEAREELVRESTRFDEETSFRHDPQAQARWLRRVEQELAKTAPALDPL